MVQASIGTKWPGPWPGERPAPELGVKLRSSETRSRLRARGVSTRLRAGAVGGGGRGSSAWSAGGVQALATAGWLGLGHVEVTWASGARVGAVTLGSERRARGLGLGLGLGGEE